VATPIRLSPQEGLKKDSKFCWETKQVDVFMELKIRLVSAPIFKYIDFVLKVVMGAVLNQGYEEGLHSLNYHTSNKELFAIRALKTWKHYLALKT
jgi:hypothetical protein